MRSSYRYLPTLLIFVFLSAACSRSSRAPSNTRIAIEIFENQSAQPGDDWAGALVAYACSYRLSRVPEYSPNVVRDREALREIGAGRLIQGTVRRSAAGFEVDARLIDTASTGVLKTFSANAPDAAGLLSLAANLSEAFTGTKPIELQGSAEAWRDFATAELRPRADSMAKVVADHPSFAPAYPVLIDLYLRTADFAPAQAIAARLPANADSLSRAQTNYLVAPDSQTKAAATQMLLTLRPTDTRLRADLASLLASQSNWKGAISQYEQLTKLEPANTDWWNGLGYANANAKRMDQAMAAFEEYRKLAPNDANPNDSLGEAFYLNRRFREAAEAFDKVTAKAPGFLNGAVYRKAAFAYHFAGDNKTADARLDNWLKIALGNAPPSQREFQKAIFLARTGRGPEALRLMASEIESSTGERRAIAQLHEAILRFGLEGTRPTPALFQSIAPQLRDPATRNSLSVFALLSAPAESEAALIQRVNAALPQPQLATLRAELSEAARRIYAPTPPAKPDIFPLPNALETPVTAMLLRSLNAVIP